VGRRTTARGRLRRAASLGLFGLAVACSPGSDPDPGDVRRELERAGALPVASEEEPEAASVALGQVSAAPAPMGETATREQLVERRPVVAAVGRDASHCFDSTVEKAFAAVCPDLGGSFLACSDRDATGLVQAGRADFGLHGGNLTARDLHAGLRQTRVGLELFALAVAPDFPARSLTRVQVRQVLTGQVGDWKELGFDVGPVVVVVPSDLRLAERAARTLILGDDFGGRAVRVASDRHVADQILRHKGAIGVVRPTARALEPEMRLLQIDWTMPSGEAYGYGTYPWAIPVHVVTAGLPEGPALRFVQFLQGDEGRELLGRTLLLP